MAKTGYFADLEELGEIDLIIDAARSHGNAEIAVVAAEVIKKRGNYGEIEKLSDSKHPDVREIAETRMSVKHRDRGKEFCL